MGYSNDLRVRVIQVVEGGAVATTCPARSTTIACWSSDGCTTGAILARCGAIWPPGSMAGLCAPLSTLRRCPRGHLRMTRGRCGSLLLHRWTCTIYSLPVSRRTPVYPSERTL
jgi:hypothetical protein